MKTYRKVNTDDLKLGDIVIGCLNTGKLDPFTRPWEVTRIRTKDSTWAHFTLTNPSSGEQTNWSPSRSSIFAVEWYEELKYDPNQQGDTDEDI